MLLGAVLQDHQGGAVRRGFSQSMGTCCMSAAAWVGAIFGLVGTILGGAVSIATTIMANRLQVRATRQQVIEQRIDTAAELAVNEFVQLKRHFGIALGSDLEVERNEQWEVDLHERLASLEPVLLRLRHSELRDRLIGVSELIYTFDLIEDVRWGGHPLLPKRICDHALSCLGAFMRDEILPQPHAHFRQAENAVSSWSDAQST